MRKVGRAVERIDNPSMLARSRVRPALLREDRMIREGAVERPNYRLFRFPGGLGDKIYRVGLAGDFGPAQTPQMDTPGRARGAERYLLEFAGRWSGCRVHRSAKGIANW